MAALPPAILAQARTNSNPYEGIGKSVFVNRSAVKLANLDALFRLTDDAGNSKSTRNVQTRGWGLTLKGDQDFALDKMHYSLRASDLFTPCYGSDCTGDIYKNENIGDFAEIVRKGTDGEGVDLVMGDGGFSTAGDEWHQEEQSKQIMLCQVLTMFLTLRNGGVEVDLRVLKRTAETHAVISWNPTGGDFVLKVFDLFSPFMVDLIYILHCSFEKISILKPFSSRPANSERYVVCKSLLDHERSDLIDHLFAANSELNAQRPPDTVVSSHSATQPGFQSLEEKIAKGVTDVLRLVDGDVVKGDDAFENYVQGINVKMSMMQTDSLKELYKYAGDPTIPGFDQEDVRRRCSKQWMLPEVEDKTRHKFKGFWRV
ncbi:FtsJ methyltransferase domain-containing protein 2 [Rhizophlyctis rosea]|uniref:Cap-specific mRNA (nucleoside-2'-O-)-methyltransferase 1 n=1 Tax=Rhizophlyctis rosea TaxID=64517 RepID=A0AAD5S9E4_9FUNG|nr:FtsJ methyltransferase domain-containing protein 2 [Rhizophlyctis rosea]